MDILSWVGIVFTLAAIISVFVLATIAVTVPHEDNARTGWLRRRLERHRL